MRKSRILSFISGVAFVMSGSLMAIDLEEGGHSVSEKKVHQKTPVRLPPKTAITVAETSRIPEEYAYLKEELKYDKERKMYYYGPSLNNSKKSDDKLIVK